MTGQVERDLLRAIDDAETRLRHYRVTFALLLFAFLASLSVGIAGVAIGVLSAAAKIDMSGSAFIPICFGLLGALVSGGFITWWWELHHNENAHYMGPPSRLVTQAKRAHEDHLMADADA